jgi:mRNA-degrading endonuclease YafQ of YafQ-DinJ toxin-antitoxin module
MTLIWSPRFKREFSALPEHIKERARKKFALFLANPRHPSLQTHKMAGWGEIWEGHISGEYRFTFLKQGDIYTLRRIGTHEIYKSP